MIMQGSSARLSGSANRGDASPTARQKSITRGSEEAAPSVTKIQRSSGTPSRAAIRSTPSASVTTALVALSASR